MSLNTQLSNISGFIFIYGDAHILRKPLILDTDLCFWPIRGCQMCGISIKDRGI